MREMSGFEYGYMAVELNRLLAGKHLQKFQKVAEGIYRMRFEKFDVICELGRRIHITSYLEDVEEADNFVQKVKKEIDGKSLESVKQLNNDRLLEFTIGGFSLVFEMFKKGNALLLKQGKIVAILNEAKWAGRDLHVGEEYLRPPKPPAALEEAINNKMIITSLLKLSLGKEYALEILRRSNVDEKAAGTSLDAAAVAKLQQELNLLVKNAEPFIFLVKDKPVNFGLTNFSEYKESKKCETLSEAADLFYVENKAEEAEPEELGKLRNRLQKQEEYLLTLHAEEQEYKAAGDWFYANYAFVEQLLKDAKAEGIRNLENLKEKYPQIKEIDKEKKKIVLES